jgi:hypothetical protein
MSPTTITLIIALVELAIKYYPEEKALAEKIIEIDLKLIEKVKEKLT